MTSGSGRLLGADAERVHADLERLHLTVVVGAPDVDEVLPARARPCRGGTRGRCGGRWCCRRLHEHPVALVAEVLGAQPVGAVLLVGEPVGAQVLEHRGDLAALVQRALGEPGVEVHADAAEVVPQRRDDRVRAPLARLAPR